MKSLSEIEEFIVDFIRKTTGAKEIDMTNSLMDYGMVSMTIATLAGEITDKLGIACDPVILYEQPNIQCICNELWNEYSVNNQVDSKRNEFVNSENIYD